MKMSKNGMVCYLTPVRYKVKIDVSPIKVPFAPRPMKEHPAVIKARKAATYALIRSGITDPALIRRMVKAVGLADCSSSAIAGCKAAITKGQFTYL